MHRPSPADELANIRAEIARLRLREAALRAECLRAPADQLTGRWSRVEVATRITRVFAPDLLPPSVQGDPRYWRDRVTLVLRCLPILPGLHAPRPGWPIARAGGAADVLH